MNTVFLSASIPLPGRHPKYLDSADVVAIRDSIRALVNVVAPDGQLVFGGHPAITPLVRLLVRSMSLSVREHVILYQSQFFEAEYPSELSDFEEVRCVEAIPNDRDASLAEMREIMLRSHDYSAGVFIGGMEGVEVEFDLFRKIHPLRPAYPIASTGAAAKILFEKYCPDRRELVEDLRYLSLFRSLLNSSPRS
jgi:hypothetical protein